MAMPMVIARSEGETSVRSRGDGRKPLTRLCRAGKPSALASGVTARCASGLAGSPAKRACALTLSDAEPVGRGLICPWFSNRNRSPVERGASVPAVCAVSGVRDSYSKAFDAGSSAGNTCCGAFPRCREKLVSTASPKPVFPRVAMDLSPLLLPAFDAFGFGDALLLWDISRMNAFVELGFGDPRRLRLVS